MSFRPYGFRPLFRYEMCRQMQTETSTTKSRAHRTAIPAFAPVLRPSTGGSGKEVGDGLDIMVGGVKKEGRGFGVVETCTVGAGFVDDEAGIIRGVDAGCRDERRATRHKTGRLLALRPIENDRLDNE